MVKIRHKYLRNSCSSELLNIPTLELHVFGKAAFFFFFFLQFQLVSVMFNYSETDPDVVVNIDFPN